jgi:hypothetical protein
VKRGSAEDRTNRFRQFQILDIRLHKGDTIAIARHQISSRFGQHIRRSIDGDDSTAREALEQVRGEATGAAARVDYRLVSDQGESTQDLAAPAHLRCRNAVVGGGVPLLRQIARHNRQEDVGTLAGGAMAGF